MAGRPPSEAQNHPLSTSLSKMELDQQSLDDKLEPVKDANSSDSVPPAFNPGWRFYAAFSSVSAITLMVALDASSLGNALPVSLSHIPHCFLESIHNKVS
jgi:hypothetical protein